MMRKITIFSAAVVIFGGVILYLRRAPAPEDEGKTAEASPHVIRDASGDGKLSGKPVRGERSLAVKKGKRKLAVRRPHSQEWTLDDFDDDEHPYSAADKKVALELQVSGDALDEYDEDDFKPLPKGAVRSSRRIAAESARARFYKAVEAAMRSRNPSVRSACVDSCSWRGGEAMPELTALMADADPEIAEAAMDAAQTALDDMDDPALQFKTAAAYLQTFAGNEDARDMFSSTLVSAASDLVEAADESAAAENAARRNREQVVDMLAEMIESGTGQFVQAVKDAYEEITTEEWVNREEARKWAQDPDNYEAPDL